MKKFDWGTFKEGNTAVIFKNTAEWECFCSQVVKSIPEWAKVSLLWGFPDFIPRNIQKNGEYGVSNFGGYPGHCRKSFYEDKGFNLVYWDEYMPFTKDSLKNGDVVKLRSGNTAIYFSAEDAFVARYGWADTDRYTHELRFGDDEGYDVMMVYRDGKIVFDRKEPRKVTMKEVQEKFGEEVIIVED